jgi:hypothetical protein
MESFAIAPAATRLSLVFPALIALVLVLVVVLVTGTLHGLRTARFEVALAGLTLKGDWYGREIPAAQVRAAEARRVHLGAEPLLAPVRRTWGTGLPGYQAGWFRLRNGESALLYLTDRTKAVYVPTTAGYSLLLSPADPDAFLVSLRSTLAAR